MNKITFTNKVSAIISSLPLINRITADDINEIKQVVNENADEAEAMTGTTIYENSNGVKADFSFATGITSADSIEITYFRLESDNSRVYKSTGKIKYTADMYIQFDLIYPVSSILQLEAQRIKVTNSGIEFKAGYFANVTSTGVTNFGDVGNLYIERVTIY